MPSFKKKRATDTRPALVGAGSEPPPAENDTKKRSAPRKPNQPKAPVVSTGPPLTPPPQAHEPGGRVRPAPSQTPEPPPPQAHEPFARERSAPSQTPEPPPPQADEPSACERPAPSQTPGRQAEIVKRAIIPACLASALQMNECVGASGYRLYLEQLRREAGDPSDPIEIMLLEQLAICHLRAAQLQGRAGEAVSMEAIELYNIAAARLSSEFRKTALALQTYRDRRPTA